MNRTRRNYGSSTFLDKDGTFTLDKAENYSYLYLPVANEKGLKAAVTPDFGGDSKVDQNTFLMEPVSAENLHNNRSTRNFWCQIKGIGSWSVTGASAEAELNRFTEEQEESTLTAGFMWQTVTRSSEKYGLSAKVTSFAPLAHVAEIMQVEICNESKAARTITPVAAVPVYGRSADNIRDHRHVTSLLHRITVTTNGVCVRPTMSFDERGHKKMRWFIMSAVWMERETVQEIFIRLSICSSGKGEVLHIQERYWKTGMA